jgi:hypothetical protein
MGEKREKTRIEKRRESRSITIRYFFAIYLHSLPFLLFSLFPLFSLLFPLCLCASVVYIS